MPFLPIAMATLLAAASAPDDSVPPVLPNVIDVAVERALPAVVKLYGASIGAAHGYGTGVLVSADGLILTVDSVLLDSSNLRAVLGDGRRFRAELVRRDAARDLALLKIDANRLPFLTPESSDSLQPGDAIVIAGNCFKVAEGEEQVSFMQGVLSAKATLELRRRAQPLDYAGKLLVIDAIAANPGMSGGPLLDTQGRFVGLIGPIADAAETNTRLNYAVPSEEFLPFISGTPTASNPGGTPAGSARTRAKPYLGIKLFKLGYQKKAAFIDSVAPGSPAADAGLKPDDLIVAINDRRVSSTEDFDRIAADLRPGQQIRISVKRAESVATVDLTVAEAPK